MKIYHLFFYLLAAYSSIAQKTEAYYDYFWKPCGPGKATFFTTIEKTDSGWLRGVRGKFTV